MRRQGLVLALAVGLLAPAGAQASKLVTWTTTSRYVDPTRVQFNSPPPGARARSNALRVNVLLPDGYTPKRRYPVLYLLHGHGDGYDYWASPQRGDVATIARGFPGIVVMPEGARGWYANWWNGGRRGGPAWERYHLDELVPLVERRLPILAGRRWHAIAGLSMGGEGAIYYASQRPGYFGSAASFSGVLSLQRPEWPTAFETQGEHYADVFGDQPFYTAGHDPTALAENLRWTRLFVTVGDGTPDPTVSQQVLNPVGQLAEDELRQQAQDFVAAARAVGADVTYEPKQGIHDWPYWRAALAAALRWGFFAPVAAEPRDWVLRTVAQDGGAWGWSFHFVAPPGEVFALRRSGDAVVGTGAGTVFLTPPCGPKLRLGVPFYRHVPRLVRVPRAPNAKGPRRSPGPLRCIA
jgi:S-formylglutathione hydrolase FrmB